MDLNIKQHECFACMTHKQDVKVISTWKFSWIVLDYATGKGMLFMGTDVLKKRGRFEWKYSAYVHEAQNCLPGFRLTSLLGPTFPHQQWALCLSFPFPPTCKRPWTVQFLPREAVLRRGEASGRWLESP